MVAPAGLEPARLSALGFEASMCYQFHHRAMWWSYQKTVSQLLNCHVHLRLRVPTGALILTDESSGMVREILVPVDGL